LGLVTLGVAVAGVGGSDAARAGIGAPQAGEFVGRFADKVLTALRDRSLTQEQRLRTVDALVTENLDLDRIARIALGRYWRAAAEAERQEFAALFKASVLASYSRRFEEYADRRLRVAGASPAGEDVMVESYLEGAATPIRLDWRLEHGDQGWQVLDVMVEGVSLLITYRNEFAAVIERGGGMAALLGELRRRAGTPLA
jgi:phospholipid transport system substrate-binding protein